MASTSGDGVTGSPFENLTPDQTALLDDLDLVQPCQLYHDELHECRSSGAKALRAFIGQPSATDNCAVWASAAHLCTAWSERRDWAALSQLIAFHKELRRQRQLALLNNDVWQLRSTPPTVFSDPLPDYLTRFHPQSFLAEKANELRSGTPADPNLTGAKATYGFRAT